MKTVQKQQCDSVQDSEAGTLSSVQLRKINKPIVEKKRRERINACLDELKDLLLQSAAASKHEANHSKLEKADILEMTVRHLRNVQRLQKQSSSCPTAASMSADHSGKHAASSSVAYRNGYSDCAREVATFLGRLDSVGLMARTRVLSHLSERLRTVNTPAVTSTTRPTCVNSRPISGPLTASNSNRLPLSHIGTSLTSDSVLAPLALTNFSDHQFDPAPVKTMASNDLFCRSESEMSSSRHRRKGENRHSACSTPFRSSPLFIFADQPMTSGLNERRRLSEGNDENKFRHTSVAFGNLSPDTATIKREVPTSSVSSSYDVNSNMDVSRCDDTERETASPALSHHQQQQEEDKWRPWRMF